MYITGRDQTSLRTLTYNFSAVCTTTWDIASFVMCITLVIALSANVCYLGYCLVYPVYNTWCWRCRPACFTQNIALSVGVCVTQEDNASSVSVEYQEAIVYYLGYCLVCQCLLPGILPYLPVCITWDIALSASGCYLGYCLVCQCVLPGILRCLPMFAT